MALVKYTPERTAFLPYPYQGSPLHAVSKLEASHSPEAQRGLGVHVLSSRLSYFCYSLLSSPSSLLVLIPATHASTVAWSPQLPDALGQALHFLQVFNEISLPLPGLPGLPSVTEPAALPCSPLNPRHFPSLLAYSTYSFLPCSYHFLMLYIIYFLLDLLLIVLFPLP